MQTLFIPWKLPGLNEIIGMRGTGHHQYYRKKADIEEMIHLECLAQHIKPAKKPVMLRFQWQEPDRRRDKDNIAAGKKFILDGLVQAGILEGDGWKHILGWVDYFVVDKEKPGVQVTIDEP